MGANSSAAVPPGYVPPPMYNKAGKPIVPKVRYGATPRPMYRPAGPAGAYYGGGFGGYPGSAALSLDAADGVIDGRYFGAPISGARPYNYASRPIARQVIAAPTYTAPAHSALALDAADGVIDGRYFGAPIAHRAAPVFHHAPTYLPPMRYGANPALSLDAADGVIDGRYFGAPIAHAAAPAYAYGHAPTYLPHNPALALDAADGVIDGRFYGAPIANASVHVPTYLPHATTTYASHNPAALSLDAADGVIDGRFFGAPIASTPALAGAYAPAVLPSMYSTSVLPSYAAAPTVMTGNYSSALALDAADGRIDGKYFGSNIATPGFGAVSIPAPVSYGTQYVTPAAYPGSAAFAMDAADGVLDGRYFGAPIVGQSTYGAPAVTAYGARTYGATSAATALDAADGVLDGRYFGSPIVQQYR